MIAVHDGHMTTTQRRTDIHAPGSEHFDPEAYRFVGAFDNHPEDGNPGDRRRIVSELVAAGYRFGHGSSGQCGHCGTRIRYAALMVHDDSRTFIFVGEQCLDNRFSATQSEFQALRDEAARKRAAHAIVAAREAFVRDHPEVAPLASLPLPAPYDTSDFLCSLARSLRSYGTLTERQLAAVPAAIERAEQYAEREARRAAEAAERAANDRYLGKIDDVLDVTGTITTALTVDGYAPGTTQRMIVVRTPVGSAVIYSNAKWAREADRGDAITYTGTVKKHKTYQGAPSTIMNARKVTVTRDEN